MSPLPNPQTPSDPLRLASQNADPRPDGPIFNPPPNTASDILQDLANPYKCFATIAKERGTTLEGLTLWMLRPDIARRLDALESACIRRSRLQASSFLPLCIDALARAITGAANDEAQTASLRGDPKHDEQRRKSREALLRMTRVMMQLSRFEHPSAKAATSAPTRPVNHAPHPIDPHTSNTPAPSRVSATTTPRSAEYPGRPGDVAPPLVGPTDQSQNNSGRTPQSDPRMLVTA